MNLHFFFSYTFYQLKELIGPVHTAGSTILKQNVGQGLLANGGHCPFAQKRGLLLYQLEPCAGGQQSEALPAHANDLRPALLLLGSGQREAHAKFLHKVKCFWRKRARVKLAVRLR